MHLMTVGTKDNEIGNGVVGAVTVQMGDLQNISDTEATMGTDWIVPLEGEFAVVNAARRYGWYESRSC